jgi:hypothetical protein
MEQHQQAIRLSMLRLSNERINQLIMIYIGQEGEQGFPTTRAWRVGLDIKSHAWPSPPLHRPNHPDSLKSSHIV